MPRAQVLIPTADPRTEPAREAAVRRQIERLTAGTGTIGTVTIDGTREHNGIRCTVYGADVDPDTAPAAPVA